MTAVKKYALLPLCGLTLFCARAQMPATNYDESQVPAYTLPDPLTTIAGKKVTDAETWISERRPELLSLFESEVYGKAPGRPEGLHFEVLSEDRYTLGNMATRREIAVYFTESDAHFMTILLYIPNKRTDAVPVFLGLNFKGNHTICDDPLVTESVSRIKPREEGGSEVRAKGFPRAAAASRWPVEMLIANGYGLATIYRGDIDPDYDDGFQNGVHPLFYREGQTKPAPDEWGTIAAWAWGLSRAMDYLETDEDVDASRVAVIGHSRHGKTALWAAAVDPRFAMAVSNDSGCGGAALSRRCYGETVARINSLLPALVLRELQPVFGQRGGFARRPARTDCADSPAPGVYRQRRRGPLGRSERRVPRGGPRHAGLRVVRPGGTFGNGTAPNRRARAVGTHRPPRPFGRPRHHALRLAAIREIRGQTPETII